MIFDFRRKGTTIRTSQDLAELIRSPSSMAGVEVTPNTAMRYAPVFACVRVLAESVGQLPLHLFVKKGARREKAEDHPLYWLMYQAPNDFMTAQEWREMVIAHLLLRGNHFAFINRGRSDGDVLELLPLNPDAVTIKQRDDGGGVEEYKVRFTKGGVRTFAPKEILHIRGMTLDGVHGVSVIAYGREAIGLGVAVDRHAGSFFGNGAAPGGVLHTDKALTDESYKRIKDGWEDRHQGPENAHRVAILEEGLKWAQVGLSAEDAQMLETKKYTRTEICGLFRVPPVLIGDLERATYTNSEQQARHFIDYSLMPYLTRIEARTRMQLLTPDEQRSHYFKHNVAALLRGDMTARSNFYTRQLQNGALSPNEIREFEDQNPREGGDIYLTPVNLAINGKLPDDGTEKESKP